MSDNADEAALPHGKTCGDCTHWRRCKALIQDLDGGNTACDFVPSRFIEKTPLRSRLEARRPNGEMVLSSHGAEADLRIRAERMATVHGQRYWKYDLYEGNTLKATYKRRVWTEHWEGKA